MRIGLVMVGVAVLLILHGCKREPAECKLAHTVDALTPGPDDDSYGACNKLCKRSGYETDGEPIVRTGFVTEIGMGEGLSAFDNEEEKRELEAALRSFAIRNDFELVVVTMPAIAPQPAWQDLFTLKHLWSVGKGYRCGGAMLVIAPFAGTVAWDISFNGESDCRVTTIPLEEMVSKLQKEATPQTYDSIPREVIKKYLLQLLVDMKKRSPAADEAKPDVPNREHLEIDKAE